MGEYRSAKKAAHGVSMQDQFWWHQAELGYSGEFMDRDGDYMSLEAAHAMNEARDIEQGAQRAESCAGTAARGRL